MDAPVYKAERIDGHIMFNCYLNNMMGSQLGIRHSVDCYANIDKDL